MTSFPDSGPETVESPTNHGESPKPSSAGSDHRADPAAALAGTTPQHRQVTFDPYYTLLVSPAIQLVLRVLRGGAPGEVARDAFPHLNLLLLCWSVRRFYHSPRGSVARARARFAVWVLTTTFTAALTSNIAARLPLRFAVVAWAMAAGIVGFGLCGLLFHEDK